MNEEYNLKNSENSEKDSKNNDINALNTELKPETSETTVQKQQFTRSKKQFKEYNSNKNLYSDARSCSVKILCRCERTDSYLDKLVDSELRNSTLNDFDKSLLNELTHGVIRWMRRLDWFLNGFYRGQYEKCLPEVKNALRVALYQILFLNKIPYSAAVNEAVEFVKRTRGEKHAGVVNGLLRTIIKTLDSLVWPTREIDEVNYLGIIQSHPNWIVRRWINRFGFDEAQKLCEANNIRPSLSIRVNTQKITSEEFEKIMKEKNLLYRKSPYIENFFSTKTMSKIYEDEYFKKGYFTIQDDSAGLVSMLLSPKENEVILDVCSAPGGKTSHISELMNGTGKIIALDKYLSRVETTKANLERLGIKNTILLYDDIAEPKSETLKSKLIGRVDKVLVDAPCSGFGVITKKPDIKWKRELEDIIELQKIQIEILESSKVYLKPGGVLIYSTCTTEQEENSEVVKLFLEKNQDFKIENAGNYLPEQVVNTEGFMEVFPHTHKTDGGFAARLIKKQ